MALKKLGESSRRRLDFPSKSMHFRSQFCGNAAFALRALLAVAGEASLTQN
jgi:hypothetical protein